MPQVDIENPVINSPFEEPMRSEIDEAVWASLYSTVSRPFDVP